MTQMGEEKRVCISNREFIPMFARCKPKVRGGHCSLSKGYDKVNRILVISSLSQSFCRIDTPRLYASSFGFSISLLDRVEGLYQPVEIGPPGLNNVAILRMSTRYPLKLPPNVFGKFVVDFRGKKVLWLAYFFLLQPRS